MAKTPRELDRLAWKQRIEEVERIRKRTRTKEWLARNSGDLLLVAMLAVVIIGSLIFVLGG
jgi:cytochrome b561